MEPVVTERNTLTTLGNNNNNIDEHQQGSNIDLEPVVYLRCKKTNLATNKYDDKDDYGDEYFWLVRGNDKQTEGEEESSSAQEALVVRMQRM